MCFGQIAKGEIPRRNLRGWSDERAPVLLRLVADRVVAAGDPSSERPGGNHYVSRSVGNAVRGRVRHVWKRRNGTAMLIPLDQRLLPLAGQSTPRDGRSPCLTRLHGFLVDLDSGTSTTGRDVLRGS